MRYAYLGPPGTFTEAALRSMPLGSDDIATPFPTVAAALDSVREGITDGAVVPMENSVEGSVNATLDELAVGVRLVIAHEVVIPVAFDLVARAGTTIDDVSRVATHPHAEAQCRDWLARHLPDALVVPAASTAAAAEAVASGVADYDAAIAGPLAASTYSLTVLANGIQDTDAHTRFVLLTPPGNPPEPTGHDKTTLVVFMKQDRTGALLEILEQFATRGVNLTRIESRPVGARLGNYCFSIDCEGHVAEARVGEALMGLHRVCADVRYLGSYARADGKEPTMAESTSDEHFAEAQRWLSRLRGPSAP